MQNLESVLREKLSPVHLEITDESHQHAGHGNFKGQAGSHFRALIVSVFFEGKSLVQRHRLVNETVFPLLEGQIHALALRTLTPKEWKS